MPTRITRVNPRTGHVERPWRNRDGVFVLGDPAHGAQRHHEKFAVKVGTIEEVAALVARGFSVRMTDGESSPSLIAPDSLTIEEVEGADEASLYAEMAPKPPFPKEAMMEELKRAMLVQANQIAHAGRLEFAVAFMGFESVDETYPYGAVEAPKVDLRRFNATDYLEKAYDYAYQVGRHRLFDDAVAQDVHEFIRGANPSGSDGVASPLADPNGMCRRAADTAFGRWKLGKGHDLSARELSLLAQMTEAAVRNSLSKERVAIGKTGVENATALGWLRQRRDFVPTRTEEASRDNWVAQSRFLLDQREFGDAFVKIMDGLPTTAAELATKTGVGRAFVDALMTGRPLPDVEKLKRVGLALELDAAHFAGAAIRTALRQA